MFDKDAEEPSPEKLPHEHESNFSVDGVMFLREHVSPTGKISLAETDFFQRRKQEKERSERIEAKAKSPARVVESTRAGALTIYRNADETIIFSNRTDAYDTSLGKGDNGVRAPAPPPV